MSQNTDNSVVRSLLALHKNRKLVLTSTVTNSPNSHFCPGLFYPTAAKDGILNRIRIPGGCLQTSQIVALANLSSHINLQGLQITNRANLQLKTDTALPADVLQELRMLGLAGQIAEVDHLRNIMASPTAGFDPQASIDTRPIITALDQYISNCPDLADLSPKFSVGIDGGEAVSIRRCPNDVMFVAEGQKLRLFFGQGDGSDLDSGLLCTPEAVSTLVQAIIQQFLATAGSITSTDNLHRRSRQPRLRQSLAHWGLPWWIHQLINSPLQGVWAEPSSSHGINSTLPTAHLGRHAQVQSGYSYFGLVIPLGQLSIAQLQILGKIADQYGSGELRLTPWQNIVLPNVSDQDISNVSLELSRWGISDQSAQPAGSIAACRGQIGCQAAETHSQQHARDLIQHLSAGMDQPLHIHISGCDKGCAHPYGSDIALRGMTAGQTEGYEIYIPAGNQIFGCLLYSFMPAAQALLAVKQMLCVYQLQRYGPQESWQDFAARHTPAMLRQLFDLQI